jgi:TonB family protein
MQINRLLRFTLAFSLLAHGMILLQSPNFNPFTPAPKFQEIAVRYIKVKPLAKPLTKGTSFSEPLLKLDSKITGLAAQRAPLPYVEQPDSSAGPKAVLTKPAAFAKPVFSSPEITAIKKRVTLPAMPVAKIDNPSYISYYQIVREKIRRSAYQNYTHNVTGEVYVSFIIANDGRLVDAHLVEEKTTVNDYLQNIALRSVRDASPFPAFPKELDYPQLSFNIIISFEIE